MDQRRFLEELCDRLDDAARRIAPITAPAERLAGADTWIGPAADDALVALGSSARAAGEAAVALRRTAAAVRARIAAPHP